MFKVFLLFRQLLISWAVIIKRMVYQKLDRICYH